MSNTHVYSLFYNYSKANHSEHKFRTPKKKRTQLFDLQPLHRPKESHPAPDPSKKPSTSKQIASPVSSRAWRVAVHYTSADMLHIQLPHEKGVSPRVRWCTCTAQFVTRAAIARPARSARLPEIFAKAKSAWLLRHALFFGSSRECFCVDGWWVNGFWGNPLMGWIVIGIVRDWEYFIREGSMHSLNFDVDHLIVVLQLLNHFSHTHVFFVNYK